MGLRVGRGVEEGGRGKGDGGWGKGKLREEGKRWGAFTWQ